MTLEILWQYRTCSAPDEYHHHAIAGAIRKRPSDWKRPPERLNHTWLGDIEPDLRPLNISPSHGYAQEEYATKRECVYVYLCLSAH